VAIFEPTLTVVLFSALALIAYQARTNNNRVEFPVMAIYNHTGIRVQRLVQYGAGYQHLRLILVA
jgi:hypothetical protein